jgi:HlyD family secretion protein
MKIFSRRTAGIVGGLALVGVGAVAFTARGADGAGDVETVRVERADVVDKALAVGQIEPDVEVSVKSQVSGVLKRLHADIGDHVSAGTPLLEIKPNPTPLQLVEARREVEMAQVEIPYLEREKERMEQLRDRGIVTVEELESIQQRHEEAKLQLQLARERLALLEEGRVQSASGDVETTIRAPVDGFILEKMVEVGDPVVPLTPSQEGTVLMTMAEMEHLIFRGTVDEIDVGRLEEGMPAEIKVGALPDARIPGNVQKISLKARKEENATVFPVEIAVEADSATILRAGYSANAELIIEERQDVLTVPERVVEFEGDSAFVEVLLPDGTRERRQVETGLSDAVRVQVLSGLEEGERVVEPKPREID